MNKMRTIRDYCGGMIEAERFPCPIKIFDWVAHISGSCIGIINDPNQPYVLLKEQGKYFNVTQTFPQELPRPAIAIASECHQNVWWYITSLARKHPHLLSEVRFAIGAYGMWIISPTSGKKHYFVCNHSFITYQGSVVDITPLPQNGEMYEVDQYFGIEYEIPHVVEKLGSLIKRTDGEPRISISMLGAVYQKLYSGE